MFVKKIISFKTHKMKNFSIPANSPQFQIVRLLFRLKAVKLVKLAISEKKLLNRVISDVSR